MSAPEAEVANRIMEVSIDEITTDYERFRLVRPHEYAAMRDSIARYGQISPVIAGQSADGAKRYELVDGFKRYRACRELGKPSMTLHELRCGSNALKAAMITLNRGQGMQVFEEALIVQSLYRDDCLNQEQIATLLGRHKSWACRRIGLCERLCEEAVEHIRLGLIGFSVARELCRLPQGNQAAALACVMKHRLDGKETALLVSRLLQSPAWEHESILYLPVDILDRRHPSRPTAAATAVVNVYEQVCTALETLCTRIDEVLGRNDNGDDTHRRTALEKTAAATQRLTAFKTALEGGLSHG